MSMHILALRAVVIPCCIYGAKIFGMNKSLTNWVQELVNMNLRAILGLLGSKHIVATSHFGLGWESLTPMCAIVTGFCARAYYMCFQLKTMVGEVIRRPI